MVIGEFNAKVGTRKNEEESIMGVEGAGKRNERGELLVEWCAPKRLRIQNSFFLLLQPIEERHIQSTSEQIHYTE